MRRPGSSPAFSFTLQASSFLCFCAQSVPATTRGILAAIRSESVGRLHESSPRAPVFSSSSRTPLLAALCFPSSTSHRAAPRAVRLVTCSNSFPTPPSALSTRRLSRTMYDPRPRHRPLLQRANVNAYAYAHRRPQATSPSVIGEARAQWNLVLGCARRAREVIRQLVLSVPEDGSMSNRRLTGAAGFANGQGESRGGMRRKGMRKRSWRSRCMGGRRWRRFSPS
ncbi:hypothetical protein DFH09DRAFT_1166731 [Mycena vulgaris]|nr:hypothetical protein DFH09DRAFT_1166731 [Mycena vulgaris]